MDTRVRRCLATVLAGVVLVAAGCTVNGEADDANGEETTEAATGLDAFAEQDLDWEDCETGMAGTECATFEVPLDYEDPDGERIEIAVKRLPAEGSDAVGSLMINPGGPGGSAYDFVDGAPYVVSDEVREQFDVVGFDPRGVGRSTPLTCLDSDELDEYLGGDIDSEGGDSDPAEVTDEGMAELEESSRAFVEACEAEEPDLMRHVSTANVARDMDVLRGLVGDEQLTYIGASYGTQIGAHYAEQFPERVRAVVLDGAVDLSQDQLSLSVEQAAGFEVALEAFVEDCLEQADCPLGGSGDSVDDGIDELSGLLASAAEEPLDNSGDDREVNRTRAGLGVLAGLYDEELWPSAREALTEAVDNGDGTFLMRMADDLYQRGSTEAYENSNAMLMAVNCSDSPSPRDVDAYAEAAEEADEESPNFGPSLAWGSLTCAFWPEEAIDDHGELDAAGSEPIMVVGTTRDSATPYQWSEALAEQLDPGFLVTRDGDGHTGYRMGDSCVDAIVDDYVIDLEVPEDGMACT